MNIHVVSGKFVEKTSVQVFNKKKMLHGRVDTTWHTVLGLCDEQQP